MEQLKTKEEKFDIVFLGAGPETLGFFVNTIRQNKIYDFMQKSFIIIDSDMRFGGGRIENQLNNANQSAADILRILLKYPECQDKDFFEDCIQNQINSQDIQQTSNSQLSLSNIMQEDLSLYNSKNFSQGSPNRSSILKKVDSKSLLAEKKKLDKKSKVLFTHEISHLEENNKRSYDSFNLGQQNNIHIKITQEEAFEEQNNSYIQQEKKKIMEKVRVTNRSKKVNEDQFKIDIEKLHTKISQATLAPFKEVLKTQCYRLLLSYGLKQPPLSLVGYFLRIMGNYFLKFARFYKKFDSLLRLQHEVVSMQLGNDGYIVLRIKQTIHDFQDQIINDNQQQNDEEPYKPKVLDVFKNIRARALILSNGSRFVDINPIQLQKFPNINPQLQVMNSRQFLTDKGFQKALRQINKLTSLNNRKIVIIGGGNAAFQCAHLLLNGPSLCKVEDTPGTKEDESLLSRGCASCCKCDRKGDRTPIIVQQNQNSYSVNMKQQIQNQHQAYKELLKVRNVKSCKCACYCYGSFIPVNFTWNTTKEIMPQYGQGEVVIAHRNEAVVFFNNETEYKRLFPKQEVNQDSINQWGQINDQFGLKGEARKLFFNIIEGQERRARLQKYQTEDDLRIILQDAHYILIAQGNQSHVYQIKDHLSKEIKTLSLDGGRNQMVDHQQRLISKNGSIKGIYGLGEGFSKDSQQYYFYQHFNGTKCLNSLLNYLRNMNFDSYWEWYEQQDTEQLDELQEQQQQYKKNQILNYDNDNEIISDLVESQTVGLDQLSRSLRQEGQKPINFNNVDNMIMSQSKFSDTRSNK